MEGKKLWIIFKRFSSTIIEYRPKDTRAYIAKKFEVINPRKNLILVQEIKINQAFKEPTK